MAFYEWSYLENIIWLKTGGYQGDEMCRKHLTLNDFESMKIGREGGGIFHFREKDWDVYWKVIDLEE